MNFKYNMSHFTQASKNQIEARRKISRLAINNLKDNDEFHRDLPSYLHSGIYARIFGIQELYLQTIGIPGLILDLGTYKGSTAIILENLRAIYEPFAHQKAVFAFDTFEGYVGFSAEESRDKTIANGTYSLPKGWEISLTELMVNHEIANGKNLSRNRVIKGDATIELQEILNLLKAPAVSLVFFDMNAFEPTYKCLEEISPYLVTGSIIAFWQHQRPEITGERMALSAATPFLPEHSIHTSKTYPSLIYVKIR